MSTMKALVKNRVVVSNGNDVNVFLLSKLLVNVGYHLPDRSHAAYLRSIVFEIDGMRR